MSINKRHLCFNLKITQSFVIVFMIMCLGTNSFLLVIVDDTSAINKDN